MSRLVPGLVLVSVLGVSAALFQNCGSEFGKKFGEGSAIVQSESESAQPESESVPEVTQCKFNGQVVAEGGVVTAYLSSAPASGASCISEIRTCENGALSGSYQYPSCEVGGKASCLFNGVAVSDGQSITAYVASSVDRDHYCVKENRVCNNGQLSGSYMFGSCSNGSPACLFNGVTISHGQSIAAFKEPSVPAGQSCVFEVQSCIKGHLTGDKGYLYPTCTVGEAKTCTFNGQTIPAGGTVIAYENSTVGFGETCQFETQSCLNGVMTGQKGYQFASCNVGAPASCLLGSLTIASGASVTAYAAKSVPYGSACAFQTRSCTNGVLTGTFTETTCSVQSPASCSFRGKVIPSGSSISAYLAPAVPYGQQCIPETRICMNGHLSGTATYPSCFVQSTPDHYEGGN